MRPRSSTKNARFLVSLGMTLALCGFLPSPLTANEAALGTRIDAKSSKTNAYVESGFFVGGQRSVTATTLRAVRHSAKKGQHERLVFELETVVEDAIKIPHYQVQLAKNESRVVLSIWANVQHQLPLLELQKQISRSTRLQSLKVYSNLEDGLFTAEIALKPSAAKSLRAEVFHLEQPPRIILDFL
jgi:hypothetical protein